MQKIVDYLSWGFILLFAAPTVLIMASWNSLPGDPMFGIKRTFEQSLLLVLRPSYDAQTTLNAQYTKRRMEEAKILLAKNQSARGLSFLSQQVVATKQVIQNAPTQEKKREAAKQYIATLQGVSQELKVQQQKQTSRATKPKIQPTATVKPIQRLASGSNQQQVQTQLDQTSALLRQLQAQLQAQQQQQSQQLLAQLNAQAIQLQQLQQQLQAEQQPQQVQQIQDQVQVQVQQIEDIQEAVSEQQSQPDSGTSNGSQEPESINADLEEAETQVEEVIQELEDIVEDTSGESGNHATGTNNGNQGNNGNRNQENNAVQDGGNAGEDKGTGQNN